MSLLLLMVIGLGVAFAFAYFMTLAANLSKIFLWSLQVSAALDSLLYTLRKSI